MPKHAFRLPIDMREAVRSHVHAAVRDTDPTRFRQEPQYVTSLVTRLEGIVYQGPHGFVRFHATVFDDRGRGAAESLFGADFSITAEVSDGRRRISKAIMFQAKRGAARDLAGQERATLLEQIAKMRQVTAAPKILEVPTLGGPESPRVLSGNRFAAGADYTPVNLADYFVRRVTTTLDGDTSPRFVDAVQESSLTKLRVQLEVCDELSLQ